MKFSPNKINKIAQVNLVSCFFIVLAGCGGQSVPEAIVADGNQSVDPAAAPLADGVIDEKRFRRPPTPGLAPGPVDVGGIDPTTKPASSPVRARGPTLEPVSVPAPAPVPVPVPVPAVAPAVAGTAMLGNCQAFPKDNALNTPIDKLPVHSLSSSYINSIGIGGSLRADFGAFLFNGGIVGIPINYVGANQPKVTMRFDAPTESDPGPYPFPANAIAESGSDRHVIVVDNANCKLYETYSSYVQPGGSYNAYSGAVFDLKSNALRPSGWTSADAAGLPIAPLLVRYDEVVKGEINHAIRFTAAVTQRAFNWPARHFASANTSTAVPPMGTRIRLKANFDISGFHPDTQVILRAIKKYGLILADNGANWFISGEPNSNWNDAALAQLRQVPATALEVVDTSGMVISQDSGQARQ
jgi:hypothetical protein